MQAAFLERGVMDATHQRLDDFTSVHEKQKRLSLVAPEPGDHEEELLTLEALNETPRISTNTWAVLLFIFYLIVGLAFFCYSSTKLSALDAIYLAVITFTTVGYGDVPITNRYFTSFYVLLGAGVVGAYFGLFSNDVMEAQEAAMQKRLVSVAKRIDGFFSNTTQKMEDYRKEKLNQMFKDVKDKDRNNLTTMGKLKQGFANLILEDEQAKKVSAIKRANMEAYEEELRELRSKGMVDFFFVIVSIVSGAVGMMYIEDWLFSQAIYWACVTATTVGYGDVVPDTPAGKVFTIIYTFIACSLAAKGFRDVVCYPLVVRAKENEAKILKQFGEELSERTLRGLLNDEFFRRIKHFHKAPHPGRSMKNKANSKNNKSRSTEGEKKEGNEEYGLYKSEFILILLRMMNKVQDKDILLAAEIFDRLDSHADGILTEEEQKEQMEKARQRDLERLEVARKRHAEIVEHEQQGLAGMMNMVINAGNSLVSSKDGNAGRSFYTRGGNRGSFGDQLTPLEEGRSNKSFRTVRSNSRSSNNTSVTPAAVRSTAGNPLHEHRDRKEEDLIRDNGYEDDEEEEEVSKVASSEIEFTALARGKGAASYLPLKTVPSSGPNNTAQTDDDFTL